MSSAAALLAAVVVVLAVVGAFIVVGLAALRTWSDDRHGQRRLIHDQGTLWGPEGSRAAGQAWTSIAGDGPPALRLRGRGVGAETGTSSVAASSTDGHDDPGPGRRRVRSPVEASLRSRLSWGRY